MALPRLHLVTDDGTLADACFVAVAEEVLARCGPDVALHLRGHGTPGARLFELGERLSAAALRSGSWLLVNDRVDVAMAVRSNGVQLGASSLPVREARALLGTGARIGYSAHGPLEVEQARGDGADFVLLGTIYASASHPGRGAAGLDMLQVAAGRAALPVVAIGGITPERVEAVQAAGAWGVAVLSGVWQARDPGAAAAAYQAALQVARPELMEAGQ